jgi:hypothetical protein
VRKIVLVLMPLCTASCGWLANDRNANADQIREALNACGVQHKDFARDKQLNGRYLIIYYPDEPDHEQKMNCVSNYLETQGVSATAIYPGPVNREGLY